MSAKGLIQARRVEPRRNVDNLVVPPGVWCLHSSSTVPYVQLAAGDDGRVFTWGEAVELERQGQLQNVSAHVGDIILAPVVAGCCAPRPVAYALPVLWSRPVGAGVATSQKFDVRQVTRAYFAPVTPLQVAIPPLVIRQRAVRGVATGDAGAAKLAGGVYSYAAVQVNTDTRVNLAPQMAQNDIGPGAFLDELQFDTDLPATFDALVVLELGGW